ncbi:hypothetical protein MNB_ARC-1_894 [hydrothermal vent metagenome]|uniref:Uncharacterized protein n=1 Tax=hydrothermal vent metagenome TaxID=652676 RepID=A0A3B1E5A6_9ZZZZ
MAVKFISHVEQDEDGSWFIKLTDTSKEMEVICKDLEEYSVKIQEMGDEYGRDIEVVWTSSNTLTPSNYQDLSEKMAILQEKYQEDIERINNNA